MGSRGSHHASSASAASSSAHLRASTHSDSATCGCFRVAKHKSSPPPTPPPSPHADQNQHSADGGALRSNRVESSSETRHVGDLNVTVVGPGGEVRRDDAGGRRHRHGGGSGRSRHGGGEDGRSRQHSGSRVHGGWGEGDRTYVQMSCRVTVEELILDTLKLIRTLVDK